MAIPGYLSILYWKARTDETIEELSKAYSFLNKGSIYFALLIGAAPIRSEVLTMLNKSALAIME